MKKPEPAHYTGNQGAARFMKLLAGVEPAHELPSQPNTVREPAPVQEQQPVAEVKVKMTGGNVGIATVIHEIYDPAREPLTPGQKLYTAQPRKAVKLNPSDIDMLSFSYFGHHPVASMTHAYRAFAQQIEAAVWAKLGVTE